MQSYIENELKQKKIQKIVVRLRNRTADLCTGNRPLPVGQLGIKHQGAPGARFSKVPKIFLSFS